MRLPGMATTERQRQQIKKPAEIGQAPVLLAAGGQANLAQGLSTTLLHRFQQSGGGRELGQPIGRHGVGSGNHGQATP